MRNESNEKQKRFKLPADWPGTEAAAAQPRLGSAALRRKRMSNNCGCLQRDLAARRSPPLGGYLSPPRRTRRVSLQTQLDCGVTRSSAGEHLANKPLPQSVKRQLFSNAFSGAAWPACTDLQQRSAHERSVCRGRRRRRQRQVELFVWLTLFSRSLRKHVQFPLCRGAVDLC